MRGLLLVSLIAAAPPLAAQPSAPAEGQNVVVTGVRIQDYRDRLAACLARRCPANEDADATLALAEALFLNGEYADARSAVRASLGRNRNQASAFPEPVSDLFRANSRLARHIGLDREARTASFEILHALQAGIPREDHRHFTARFEIAEMQMMSGNFIGARRELGRLIQAARAAGRQDVVAVAELKDLWYELIAYPDSDARTRLLALSRATEPARRMQATGAKILLSRVLRAEGNNARADALLAEVGRGGSSAHRRLIHSPFYQLHQQEIRPVDGDSISDAIAMGRTLKRITEDYDNRWIDVGFWVLPDGHVSGLEIVRRGASTDWAEPLLDSIRGRIYSTAADSAYRLERYTFTADYETATGTYIRRRSPRGRVEYLDLTTEDAPAPSPAAAGRTPTN
ncbi:MAG: hypothetical protein QOJ53_336 [Sphingomonadales bacterium]|jgi:hypothetical protein|nr:hypothetical protein [Sphingomonadales bacterium]